MKSRAIALIACFIFTLAGAAAAAPAAKQTGRMALDGVDYYYEVHGKGEPVLILHGGLGSIDMFGPAAHVIPRVTTAGRQVIAVDLERRACDAVARSAFVKLIANKGEQIGV
jgi:hypothetical protein